MNERTRVQGPQKLFMERDGCLAGTQDDSSYTKFSEVNIQKTTSLVRNEDAYHITAPPPYPPTI